MPRSPSVRVQAPIRSIETGSAEAVPTALEIDRALARLETLAKERGVAVGVAAALPISIERLAAWIKTLESRGIMLVPLTKAMLKSK